MTVSYETPSGVNIEVEPSWESLHVQRVGTNVYLDLLAREASTDAVEDTDILHSLHLTERQVAALKEAL